MKPSNNLSSFDIFTSRRQCPARLNGCIPTAPSIRRVNKPFDESVWLKLLQQELHQVEDNRMGGAPDMRRARKKRLQCFSGASRGNVCPSPQDFDIPRMPCLGSLTPTHGSY